MVFLRYSGFRGCPGIGRYAGFDPIEHLTFSQTVDSDITLYCVETLLKRKIHSFIYIYIYPLPASPSPLGGAAHRKRLFEVATASFLVLFGAPES